MKNTIPDLPMIVFASVRVSYTLKKTSVNVCWTGIYTASDLLLTQEWQFKLNLPDHLMPGHLIIAGLQPVLWGKFPGIFPRD